METIRHRKIDWIAEAACITIQLFGALYLFSIWNQMPETVIMKPQLADRTVVTGSRDSLLLTPALSLLIYILLTVLSRYPRLYNIPVFGSHIQQQRAIIFTAINFLKAVVMMLFFIILYGQLQTATGSGSRSALYAFPLILLLIHLIVIGGIVKANNIREKES